LGFGAISLGPAGILLRFYDEKSECLDETGLDHAGLMNPVRPRLNAGQQRLESRILHQGSTLLSATGDDGRGAKMPLSCT
jgi:hypothetical protein